MSRKMITRVGGAVAVVAASGALLLGAAGAASANQFAGQTLTPGQQVCIQQYAGYQVRVDAHASGQGAKFKLQHNGVTVIGSPGLVTSWAAELRTSFGNFPGPGYYVACATNNGTADTNVQLQLRTDGEL